MLSHKTLFVFDLDGTLIDSLSDIHTSINQALSALKAPRISNAKIKSLVGPDLRHTIMDHVNNDEFDFSVFQKLFNSCYAENRQTTVLYPNVKKVLQYLKTSHKTIAVLTNKPEAQSCDIIASLGIDSYVNAIVGPDTYDAPKPSPIGMNKLITYFSVTPSDSVMIGDTEVDLQMAVAANVTSVAVTYGYRKKEQLIHENPDFFIDDLSDLLLMVSS